MKQYRTLSVACIGSRESLFSIPTNYWSLWKFFFLWHNGWRYTSSSLSDPGVSSQCSVILTLLALSYRAAVGCYFTLWVMWTSLLFSLRLMDDYWSAFSERRRALVCSFKLYIFSFLLVKHILLCYAFVFWKRIPCDHSKRLSQLHLSSEPSLYYPWEHWAWQPHSQWITQSRYFGNIEIRV